jgi:hypothetical protein
LSKGGNNHSGSLEKANILNDQFTSVWGGYMYNYCTIPWPQINRNTP